MNPRTLALWLLLLLPLPSWADPLSGISLYEGGQYEAAIQSLEKALEDPRLPPEEKGLARIYLAASLHVLGRVDESRQQLELLAREHPGQRVDPVRFLPELVALAESIRERVEAEKLYAEQAALSQRMARETARNPSPPVHLRLEGLGFSEPLERGWRLGAGVSLHGGMLEGSARAWFLGPPVLHLQAGLVPGSTALRPVLGVRAVLVPTEEGYGVGAVVGGRFLLPAQLVALVDVGADYFLVADEAHHRFAFTLQAGLGFDLPLR
jgi:tetratricopeptide (TPR) repeat protein